jgi:cytosine/adenosine deaminase-related metal-dependent hydrolase
LPYYLPLLCAAKNIILVHNTYTSEEDINFALRCVQPYHQQLFWCICIRANLYIENALPPIDLLKKKGCKIVIGTDSLASNADLNLLGEIQAILHYFPMLGLEEVLSWATYEGAKALQMEKELGSFQKGKKPGVIVIDPNLKYAERII